MALEIKNIEKTFGQGASETRVLNGIDLTIEQGEFVIITGASGSGKTTLLSILGGLLSPDKGDVVKGGTSIFSKDVSMQMRRLTEMGFIFQASHLVPYLNVQDQLVVLGKEAGMKAADAKVRAKTLLETIGLGHRLKAYPNMLSGGEKQRVAIMRAWMNVPDVILADEPTASLDAQRATDVVEMIKNKIKEDQIIGIMITHDQRLFDYADRVVYLKDGRIEQQA